MPFLDKYLLLAMLVALLGTGCAGSHVQHPSPSQEPMPTETAWRLAAFGAEAAPVTGDAEITASFSDEGRVNGSAGCNRYFGSYELGGNRLALSQMGATKMACPSPAMEQEGRFLAALGSVEGWRRRGDTLDLLDGGGETLLRFVAAAAGGRMPSQETARDYAYRCDSPDGPFTFRIRSGPGELALWLPERFEGREGGTYRVLGQVVSASGAKYQDGPVTVWTKGADEALLEVDGEVFLSCEAVTG